MGEKNQIIRRKAFYKREDIMLLPSIHNILAPFISDKAYTHRRRNFEIVGNHTLVKTLDAFVADHCLDRIPGTFILVIDGRHSGDLHAAPQDIYAQVLSSSIREKTMDMLSSANLPRG